MNKPVETYSLTRQSLAALVDGATVLCRQTGRMLTVKGRTTMRRRGEDLPVLKLAFKGAPYSVTVDNMGRYGIPKAPLAQYDGLPADD